MTDVKEGRQTKLPSIPTISNSHLLPPPTPTSWFHRDRFCLCRVGVQRDFIELCTWAARWSIRWRPRPRLTWRPRTPSEWGWRTSRACLAPPVGSPCVSASSASPQSLSPSWPPPPIFPPSPPSGNAGFVIFAIFTCLSRWVLVKVWVFDDFCVWNWVWFCWVKCSYLVAAVSLQCVWSLSMAIVDLYALLVRRSLHNGKAVCFFTIGDGVRYEFNPSSLVALLLLISH